jgi:bifunctional UDP-N-acetylglucosamine pyrophosphorylase / glucosamine-1-phosphate N-acetyltransferase
VRDAGGGVASIVEQADATTDQEAIREINAGMYVFDVATMRRDLASVSPDNAQGEYYLPDLVAMATRRGDSVAAVEAAADRVAGVNTHGQLAEAAAVLRTRMNEYWMAAGVRMIDPTAVYLDADVVLEPGAVLYPGVHLEGGTQVAAGAVLGPDTYVFGSTVGEGARVWYSVVRESEIGEGCQVGPYASSVRERCCAGRPRRARSSR